jgi:putative tricarboxylic transport membrane protein
MRHRHRLIHALVLGLLPGAATVVAATRADQPPEITVLVPGASGGGWDLTARAMKASLESEGLARVRIEMSPGPGGSVGLAQLLSGHRGDGSTLMVGGLVMLSAAASQRLTISPLDATPVARLTGDHPVLIVPASSPYRSAAELLRAVQAQTSAFPWAGGSSGSLYERLAGDLYEAAGLSRSAVNYVPHGGGREVAESLLAGRARVGLSELAEIAPYLARGELRALAVASPARIDGVDAPTLKEAGYDVAAVNWRGVFAGPGLGRADAQRLESLVAKMVASPGWKSTLEQRRWTDLYLPGERFREFLEAEQSRWSAPPRSRELPAVSEGGPATSVFTRAAVVIALLVLAGGASWAARANRRAPAEASPPEPTPLPPAAFVDDEVARAFDAWKLTPAEREIAELMLQGLRYKQIAGRRGTSERTVRQQAQIILKKAGLDGRSDLAALFLHRRAASP